LAHHSTALVAVADRQGLLEHRIVRLAQHRHQDRLVVAHVVSADLIQSVGESARMFVVGLAQKQQRGRRRAAGKHYDVYRIVFLRAVAGHVDGETVLPDAQMSSVRWG
jgi:hypothetical protein